MIPWYSNKTKPVMDYYEKGGILVAIDGDIFTTYGYDRKTNECWLDNMSGPVCLSDTRVSGWCYVNDIYPKETII